MEIIDKCFERAGKKDFEEFKEIAGDYFELVDGMIAKEMEKFLLKSLKKDKKFRNCSEKIFVNKSLNRISQLISHIYYLEHLRAYNKMRYGEESFSYFNWY